MRSKPMTLFLKDENETLALAHTLADFFLQKNKKPIQPCMIYLEGELGSGKTTFVRGFLRGLGHQGAVKSPTFTLVESYQLHGNTIHHFDLYRIEDPEELEWMGIRDYFQNGIHFIEWPIRGKGYLPPPDLCFEFQKKNEGREVTLIAKTDQGEKMVNAITDHRLNRSRGLQPAFCKEVKEL